MRLKNLQNGFTLVELMVSLAVGLLVLFMLMSVAVSGLKHVRSIKNSTRLAANAQYITNDIGQLVRQSSRISLNGENGCVKTICILMPDLTTKLINYDSVYKKISIDGTDITTSDTLVNAFTPIKGANSLQISFTLAAKNGTEQFSARTAIARRNSI